MLRIRRFLIVLVVGLGLPSFPLATYAGGGTGGGGVVVQVDGNPVRGHTFGFNAFYPKVVTVHQGDTVTWTFAANPNALHTITLIPGFQFGGNPFQRVQQVISPLPYIPDTDDGPGASVVPYNGGMRPDCGHSTYYPNTPPCPFDGRDVLNSGLIINRAVPGTGDPLPGAPPGTYSVRMNAPPGIYPYFCVLHRGMNGVIQVTRPGTPLPGAQQIARQITQQYNRDVAAALRAEAAVRPVSTTTGGHTTWTVLNGMKVGDVEIDEMIPKSLQVKPGDAVVWKPSTFHTVTFPSETGLFIADPTCEGANGDVRSTWDLSRCPSNFELAFDARAFLPSGPPGKPYTGGFYNSGRYGPGKTWSASFPRSGTFRYDCLIHTGMDGSISVTG
ncbi:MAG: hypothetical protein JOZ41_19840 [Chloroflexi bacterium]|nr:hypothetical protein [Chloroflexota bacterium]